MALPNIQDGGLNSKRFQLPLRKAGDTITRSWNPTGKRLFWYTHLVDRVSGEMAEWLKAHAWKACLPQGNVGSNPTLSASIRYFLPLTICTSSYSPGNDVILE